MANRVVFRAQSARHSTDPLTDEMKAHHVAANPAVHRSHSAAATSLPQSAAATAGAAVNAQSAPAVAAATQSAAVNTQSAPAAAGPSAAPAGPSAAASAFWKVDEVDEEGEEGDEDDEEVSDDEEDDEDDNDDVKPNRALPTIELNRGGTTVTVEPVLLSRPARVGTTNTRVVYQARH